MIDDGDCGAIGGMKIGRGNQSVRRKPIPLPLCPPWIPHYLTRAWTRAAAMGSQWLTAWAMARSFILVRKLMMNEMAKYLGNLWQKWNLFNAYVSFHQNMLSRNLQDVWSCRVCVHAHNNYWHCKKICRWQQGNIFQKETNCHRFEIYQHVESYS
jgi:hypothetical protein